MREERREEREARRDKSADRSKKRETRKGMVRSQTDAMVADRSGKKEEKLYFEQQQLTDRVCERPWAGGMAEKRVGP